MREMVIGLDQSYTDTGLCIAINGVPKYAESVSFDGVKGKSDKRSKLSERLRLIIDKFKSKYTITIVLEAVRLFSGSQPHISTSYIFSTCAMIGTLVDIANEYGVEIYWIETRSWKKYVLGSSKPSGRKLKGVKDPKKVDSVLYAKSIGFGNVISYKVERGKNKGQIRYNDNIADAICIAIAGFSKKIRKNLKNF